MTLKNIPLIGTSGISIGEGRRVKLVNYACLFMIIICSFFLVSWFLKDNFGMAITNALMILFYTGLIRLNGKGYRSIPKYCVIFVLATSVFVAADMIGRSINYHFSMIPIAGFSALLFDPKEKKSIFIAIIYPMTLFAILMITDFSLFPNLIGETLSFMPIFDYVVHGLILCATTYYLYRASIKAEIDYKELYEKHIAAQAELDDIRASAIYSSKLISLGEMASGIAHEIKTPLSHMINLSEIHKMNLARGKLSEEQTNKFADNIIQAGLKISDIIDSLNRLSHANPNREMKKIALHKIVDDALVICNHRLYLKNISIDIDIPKELPEITCNPNEICQVIINIFNNAIDALNETAGGNIRVFIIGNNNSIKICFENNGPLIPEEVKSSIFKGYFTTKKPGKGTGIGLTISRKIMLENRGKLYLDDDSDRTRFICEFFVNPSKDFAGL